MHLGEKYLDVHLQLCSTYTNTISKRCYCLTADPSDLFLPELSSDTSASQPSTISTAQLSSGSTPVPAAKKLRRSNTKDSSTATTGTASVTHRPPLAIRPAPSGFSMMQQPMLGGMGGGQWGYQHLPGYVWGTPMANSPMPLDRSCSWQVGARSCMLCCIYCVHLCLLRITNHVINTPEACMSEMETSSDEQTVPKVGFAQAAAPAVPRLHISIYIKIYIRKSNCTYIYTHIYRHRFLYVVKI